MNQPGVNVTVTDVQEGAMLTMKSPPEGVDRVRALGRHIETMHARHLGDGDDVMTMVPAAAVVAEDIEDGIRLVFIAENPATVETLRSRAREQAERIRTARCAKLPPPLP